jgi:hypothetical protein
MRAPVLAGKHSALIREIHSRRIDEIHDRDAAAHRDLLRAQNFLDRFGPPGAGFNSCIVGNDYDLAPVNSNDRGHYSCCRRLPIILVVRDEQSDLEHGGVRVAEQIDALAGREFSLFVELLDLLRAARLPELPLESVHLVAHLTQPVAH